MSTAVVSVDDLHALHSYKHPLLAAHRIVSIFVAAEFMNRVDDLVLFNRLKREHMNAIVEIQLKEVRT